MNRFSFKSKMWMSSFFMELDKLDFFSPVTTDGATISCKKFYPKLQCLKEEVFSGTCRFIPDWRSTFGFKQRSSSVNPTQEKIPKWVEPPWTESSVTRHSNNSAYSVPLGSHRERVSDWKPGVSDVSRHCGSMAATWFTVCVWSLKVPQESREPQQGSSDLLLTLPCVSFKLSSGIVGLSSFLILPTELGEIVSQSFNSCISSISIKS